MTYSLVNKYGKENVSALTFNYGQKQVLEVGMAERTCKKLGISHNVVDIRFLGDLVRNVTANISGSKIEMPTIKEVIGDPAPVTYVPNRNMILLSIATSAAEAVSAEAVFLGLQAHDAYGYWDTSPQFLEAINHVNSLNRKSVVRIEAPFVEWSKHEEILLGIELGVPFEDTLTCYNPQFDRRQVNGWIACGKCPTCAERIANFAKVGIVDPTPYVFLPKNWDKLIEEYR
jgi:7-cyano-7-deazaguanine synthase